MKIKTALLVLAGTMMLASCASTKQIAYFQDADTLGTVKAAVPRDFTLKPKDKISILVNCKDPQIASLFNLPYVQRYIGQTIAQSSMTSMGISGYTVDDNGDIDFPILGKIHVAGLTRMQVAEDIKAKLIASEQTKDATVTVEFMNLQYYVLGEVAKPGKYDINRDDLTIIDALSTAGDLTIYGLRQNIIVKRTLNGEDTFYNVNLCSAEELLKSPVYYLQQGDVIYVKPNDVRERQSTVNGNTVLSTSFWISLASMAITIAAVIF